MRAMYSAYVTYGVKVLSIVEPSSGYELVVTLPDTQAYLLPCYLVNLLYTLFGKIPVEGIVGTYTIDSVRHGINIPIVDLDNLGKNLPAAALFADDAGTSTLHCLKGCNAKGFTYGRHDKDIRVLVALVYLCPTLETWEMATVGYAVGSCKANHGLQHISATGKTESDVMATVEYTLGSLYEVFGTLLHGNAPQVCDHLLVGILVWLYGTNLLRERVYGIVHCHTLARILMILVNDCLPCQFADAHYAVSMVHAILFDAVHGRVHLASGAVEIRCMDMNT